MTQPVTTHLRDIGIRTLSEFVGEPTQVFGQGEDTPTPDLDLSRILAFLAIRCQRKRIEKAFSETRPRYSSEWIEEQLA